MTPEQEIAAVALWLGKHCGDHGPACIGDRSRDGRRCVVHFDLGHKAGHPSGTTLR